MCRLVCSIVGGLGDSTSIFIEAFVARSSVPKSAGLAAIKVTPASQEDEAILCKSEVFARMLGGGPGGEEMALIVSIGKGCSFALTLRGQGIDRLASHGFEAIEYHP